MLNGETDVSDVIHAMTLADSDQELYARVLTRCVLARCYHRLGHTSEANTVFGQAQELTPSGHEGLAVKITETRAFLANKKG